MDAVLTEVPLSSFFGSIFFPMGGRGVRETTSKQQEQIMKNQSVFRHFVVPSVERIRELA
jgi:hypothetical protein